MALAREIEPQDRDAALEIAASLKTHGVAHTGDRHTHAHGHPSAKPEPETFVERARVRDLAQEQGKHPEGVLQIRPTWADRIVAARAEAVTRGDDRASMSAYVRPTQPQQTARTEPGQEPATTKSWAERIADARSSSERDGKPWEREAKHAAERIVEQAGRGSAGRPTERATPQQGRGPSREQGLER